MELHKVPSRYAHKRAHRKMERLMVELYRSFEKEGPTIIPRLMDIIENWWNQHILNLDQKDLESISLSYPDHPMEEEFLDSPA